MLNKGIEGTKSGGDDLTSVFGLSPYKWAFELDNNDNPVDHDEFSINNSFDQVINYPDIFAPNSYMDILKIDIPEKLRSKKIKTVKYSIYNINITKKLFTHFLFGITIEKNEN